MPWKLIGLYTLTNDWILTPPVIGEVFRIKHLPVLNPENKYIKAVFAQAFNDGGLNIFEPKRLSYRTEPEVFIHFFPTGISQRQLAFKRLDDNTNILWRIQAEVFSSGNPEGDLANLLVSRITDFMAIYSRGNSGLIPNSGNSTLQAGTPTRIVNENSDRQMFVLRTGDVAVDLYSSVNENGQPQGLIESLKPNEVYEFPAEQGIYRGEIFGMADVETQVSFTEYVA